MQVDTKGLERLLQDEEELLYVIKPNKSRFVWANNIFQFLAGTLFASPFIIICILILCGTINIDGGDDFTAWFFLGFSLLFLLIIYAGLAFNGLRYKNTVYGVTAHRLLIQEGAINMSYRSYDLKDIETIDVRIGLLDRTVKPETGSLCFFTMATAFNQNNAQNSRFGGAKACIFQAIEEPYEWYKKIDALRKENQKA